jgi:hypothetical protein
MHVSVRYDGPVLWDLRQMLRQVVGWNMTRARNVAGTVLILPADVNDNRWIQSR